MKYFIEDGLKPKDLEALKLIDEEWVKRETDPNWTFISKAEIQKQVGFDNITWNRIKDLLPIHKTISEQHVN